MTGGDVIGTVRENNLFEEHRILLPPKAKGQIVHLTESGMYNVNETLLEVEF